MNHGEDQSLLTRYWGKADETVASGTGHHSVLGHSLDVAACAFALLDRHTTLRQQFAYGAGIELAAAPLTFAAVCALHDVGKLDTRFQRKVPRVADFLRPTSKGVTECRYDHGTEGFRQLEDEQDSLALLQNLLGPAALALLRAVCGHHGTLPAADDPDPKRMNVSQILRDEDARARRVLIKTVLGFFASLGAQVPWPIAVNGATVQRLAGLCAVADWLGSNVEHFPYAAGLVDLDAYWKERAYDRAPTACRDAGLVRASVRRTDFAQLFPGKAPRDVQMITESLDLDSPALVIVEAEMGKGKTEAALSMAARLLSSGMCDGITVALPTMATSNAMFERVNDVVQRLFVGDQVQFALAHGRASREPRLLRLVRHSMKARDPDAPEASVMCARWLLQKKRILLAQVGVGTIDQALQAALVVRHQFVRMFGLSRNVVVLDEVHAYDAYMEVLIEHLLAWLRALGVPVVLLSATLPSVRRMALARAWRGDSEELRTLDEIETASVQPYPMVTVSTPCGTKTYALPPAPTASSRTLKIERCASAVGDTGHLERVARRLVAAAQAGARAVWIRNTVREAQQAFRVLAACAVGVEHTLFHARFRGCDRAALEEKVLRDFGKKSRSGGRILIATQVVEQSLDLDFDELHTDLAPVDLLLQRAGRLHRHVRPRPPGFDKPHIVVHCPSNDDVAALRFGPSRFVYDAGTLWLADRALRGRAELHLPGDIRPLVEQTYHPVSRAALLPLGGNALVAAEEKREAQLEAKRTKARRCCIPPMTAESEGGSVLDDDDDAAQAFTRDGMSTTLVPLRWDGGAARALDEDESAPPWHLDPDAPDAWRVASHLLDQTLSLPARSDVEAIGPNDQPAAWQRWKTRFARFADDCGLGRRIVALPLVHTRTGYKGWLRIGVRRRRVLYSPTLGLVIPSEKDDEQQR